MAASLNRVVEIGNLTRDPELQYTPSGTAKCSLGVAVNRTYKNSNGEYVDDVSYFDIIAWGKLGETCHKYLTKGRQVAVEGRLQQDRWEKDGQKRSKVFIVADSVQFLGSHNENEMVEQIEQQTEEVPF